MVFNKKKYIVATRPSLLATTQTEQTVNLLREINPGIEFEIVKFSTYGDKVTDKPLTDFGGIGIFVMELENAILDSKADFAVHSLKDVPAQQPDGLCLACFAKREDPRDILLTKDGTTLAELPESSVIGTGSPRRIVQIAKVRPDLKFKDLRGNLDTRLRKLHEGNYDAIVLAAAGMRRLGKEIPEYSFLSVENFIPAIGQGTITIECKSDDSETIELLRSISDKPTEIATIAERSFMTTLGAGCKYPLGAYAKIIDNKIRLTVMIGNHFTYATHYITEESNIEEAENLGIKLATEIKKVAPALGVIF